MKLWPLALGCLLTFATLGHAQEPALPALEEQAFKEAIALVAPSLVRIETVGGIDQIDGELLGTGTTTGLVVGEDGWIVSSAYNFIAKPATILVKLPDERTFPAKLVATDRQRMLSLLKIEQGGLVVPKGSAELVRVGQWGIAVGRSYESELPSISVGVVSALNRVWGKAVQTDAKVSPVNYGGPLVNVQGEVIGVLVPMSPQGGEETAGVEWYDSGIGFAVPWADAVAAAERMKAGKDLEPGLMGLTFKGDDFTMGQPAVEQVRINSPAAEAGIKAGDTLLELGGKPLDRLSAIKYVLGRHYAGDALPAKLKRGEETIEVTMTLVDELVPWEQPYLGVLPVRPAVNETPTPGVNVRHVFAESPAQAAGLQADDRITAVNGEAVENADGLLKILGRHRPDATVKLQWERGGQPQEKDVKLGTWPATVPADLGPPAFPRYEAGEGVPERGPVGRIQGESAAHNRTYWAYVPESAHPLYPAGLVVWIHPAGNTMEADVLAQWKTICERQNLILLCPKAEKPNGWTPEEATFIQELTEEFFDKYAVDRNRVVLHTLGTGSPMAVLLANKHRSLYPAAAIVGSGLGRNVPDNDPATRQQFHFAYNAKSRAAAQLKQAVEAVKKARFPVVVESVESDLTTYPPSPYAENLGRWIDVLDRI